MSRREETGTRERNRGENPSRPVAGPPLRRWIVRRSNYPFALPGQQLGVVEATDATHALMVAGRDLHLDGPVTVEPEHQVNPELERVVARAVKSADRRNRSARFARGQSLRNPHGDGA